ncbi:MAG: hypothetical protein J6Y40_08380 [Bacteroidales bacterium]|nr:hypothetical protein [Bacteroidales bacterium]
MYNNQAILKKHTALSMSRKDIDTSLILFPVRLETCFKHMMWGNANEPGLVLFVFQSLWDYVEAVRRHSSDEELLTIGYTLVERVEDLDAVYKEDKARLIYLVKKIVGATEPQGKLSPIWDRIQSYLPRLTTLDTLTSNPATDFLRRMDAVNRTIRRLCENPAYSGYSRNRVQGGYMPSALYQAAKRHIKGCLPILLDMLPNNPEDSIVNKFSRITKKQYEKYKEVTAFLGLSTEDLNLRTLFEWGMGETRNQRYLEEKKAKEEGENYQSKDIYDLLEDEIQKFSELRLRFEERRDSLDKTMFSIIGDYYHYTFLAEKFILWSLRLASTGQDIATKEKVKQWRTIAKNTFFRFDSERQWMLVVLESFNKYKSDSIPNPKAHYLERISRRQLNCNSKFISKKKIVGQDLKYQKCLCVRIYPDVVAVTQLLKDFSEQEVLHGREFWTKYFYTDDEKQRKAAWESLCSVYPPSRAAYIAKSCFPENESQLLKFQKGIAKYTDLDLLVENIKKGYFSSVFPAVKTVEDSSDNPFSVPVSDLMPDRFILQATLDNGKRNSETHVQYGKLIPKSIQVGLNMNKETQVDSSSEGLKLKGNLRWMTDYSAAEKMGLAITVPLEKYKYVQPTLKEKQEAAEQGIQLEPKLREMKFKSIYVMGIKEFSKDNEEDSRKGSELIQKILNSHLFGEDGLDLLKLGTPTNILNEQDGSGYDTRHEAQVKEFYEKIIKPCGKVKAASEDGDADRLSSLFLFGKNGLKLSENPFLNVTDRDNLEITKAEKVNSAFLEQLSSAHPLLRMIFNDPNLKKYYSSVNPVGVFPPFRIGDQPYGIMPVCDFRSLTFPKGDKLYILRNLLLLAAENWNRIADKDVISESNMNKEGKTQKRYLKAVSATPHSVTFYNRMAVSGSDALFPDFFKGKKWNTKPLADVERLLKGVYPSLHTSEVLEKIPFYTKIPLIGNQYVEQIDAFDWGGLQARIASQVKDLNIPEDELKELISSCFDLFNYRLDAWLTGLLHKRLNSRIKRGKHKIAVGAFGWVFNLEEDEKEPVSNEYVVAPSVNHAVTASVLRSSFNRAAEGNSHNYDLSINLSSTRVRKALRIIQGVRNGLSVGSILGSDLERLMHEAYKVYKEGEMDQYIYPLRIRYPLNNTKTTFVAEGNDGSRSPVIDVLNGTALLDHLRSGLDGKIELEGFDAKQPLRTVYNTITEDGQKNILKWLYELYPGMSKDKILKLCPLNKQQILLDLIEEVEDSYDAMADVITSESVFKLTQGNQAAVDALMNALQTGRNVPMPSVTEIPFDSAYIEQRVFAALDTSATASLLDSYMQVAEPALDKWMGEMLGFERLSIQVLEEGTLKSVFLKDLGLTPSELVYLSGNKELFNYYLKVLCWRNNGFGPIPELCEGTLTEDEISLREAEIAVDSLREMLSRSRELRQNDLIGHTVDTEDDYVDKEEIKNRFASLLGDDITGIRGLLSAIKREAELCAEFIKENPNLPLEAVRFKSVTDLLLRCFRSGMTDALNGFDFSLLLYEADRYVHPAEFAERIKGQHKLVKRLIVCGSNLKERITKAKEVLEDSVPDAMKKLLTGAFVAIPHIIVQDNPSISFEDLENQLRGGWFSNAPRDVVEDQLTNLSDVRPQLASLHQLRLYGKWNFVNAALEVLPMQVDPDKTGYPSWLGAEVSSEEEVHDANVFTVLNSDEFLKKAGEGYRPAAGLVIDFWVEKIPYKRQIASLAFGYDQPDAEPPQAVLVGISPLGGNHHWSEKRMIRTIRSAMHQVKTRAVEPDHIYFDKWASAFFPILDIDPQTIANK